MVKLYVAKIKSGEGLHDTAMRALGAGLFHCFGKILSDCKIEKTQSGKPFFADCADIRFNLSHSAEYAVAALSNREVGVDIELIRPVNSRIADRFLSGIVLNEDEAGIIEAWCKKESYGKYTGSGLSGADFMLPHHIEIINSIPGYKIAVCASGYIKSDVFII